MSDFTSAAITGGSIAVAMIVTNMGRHELTRTSIVRPLALVGVFAWIYLKAAPTGTGALALYAAGVGLGAAFALVAARFTGVERDTRSGRVTTVCSTGFLVTWVVALAARLVFVWEADHNGAFREQLGRFMLTHQIPTEAIAPFFLLWAVTMVGGRLAITLGRAVRLPAVEPAPVAVRV